MSDAPAEPNLNPDAEKKISESLARTRIGGDLLGRLRLTKDEGAVFRVIVEFNATFPGGEGAARALFVNHLIAPGLLAHAAAMPTAFLVMGLAGAKVIGSLGPEDLVKVELVNSMLTDRYLFASFTRDAIFRLAALEARTTEGYQLPLIHRVWLDQELKSFVYESSRTIKCDAARAAFNCSGEGIVWAVADTGVSGEHPHFKRHGNLALPDGLHHRDFMGELTTELSQEAALVDRVGHGTHVAGIIAGESVKAGGEPPRSGFTVPEIMISQKVRENENSIRKDVQEASDRTEVSGVAQRCKILSLKVLDDAEIGQTSRLLAAIGYVRLVNGSARNLKIHGLNLSLGYPFDPEIYAAGQSPLCSEVNRLVKSGVVVVAAAGNGGYGQVTTLNGRTERAAHGSTISDPGNAEEAITVGSTHRDMPHTYGVSYFSAKGPTADGRMKPDLVAPGERIVSCSVEGGQNGSANYEERSGTSMAAPHVSGAIAAFLSVRREFRGRPELVKALLLANATDLKRQPEFQGAGMLDLMRTLQAV
jgi:hypothetical protein